MCVRVSICVYICVQVLQVVVVHQSSGMGAPVSQARCDIWGGPEAQQGLHLRPVAERMESCAWSLVWPFQTSVQ